MGQAFNKLKEQRGQITTEMSEAMAKMNRDPFDYVEGYHALPRALDALRQTDRGDLANKIENCQHTARCQSPYCQRCRRVFVDSVKNQMLQKIANDDAIYEILAGKDADLDDDDYSRYMNDHLHHISGYAGLFRIDPETVRHGIKHDRNRWIRIKQRKTNRSYWLVGNYELELVNFKGLQNANNDGSSKKQIQIQQLYRYSKQRGWIDHEDDVAVLLHWHGITNASKDALTETTGTDYFLDGAKLYKMHDCGLFVQSLHKDKPFKKNLGKIASYGIKNATRYKHTLVGSDVGDELMLKKELSDLVSVYDQVKGRDWSGLRLSHQIGRKQG